MHIPSEPTNGCYPLVAIAGRETDLELRGLDANLSCRAEIRSKYKPARLWEQEGVSDARGTLRLCQSFPAPGEYSIDVYAQEATKRVALSTCIYVVRADLAHMRPLRCDVHIHTYYSDGHESPLHMAIRGRELGLDVLAITDHNRYAPSLDAISRASEAGLNLLCMLGEEVTMHNWHMVSLNAADAVFALFESPEGEALVARTTEELSSRDLVADLTPEEYAPVKWAAETIRRFGGTPILCHPFWVSRGAFNLDQRFYDQLVLDEAIDAVELIGDVNYEDNILSVARHAEHQAAGHKLPVVGNSDTHYARGHNYGQHWTLAWTEERSAEAIQRAIVEGRTIACSTVGPQGTGQGFRAYGPTEFVEYAFFLERRFYRRHQALCKAEAADAWGGIPVSGDHAERMERLFDLCFPPRD